MAAVRRCILFASLVQIISYYLSKLNTFIKSEKRIRTAYFLAFLSSICYNIFVVFNPQYGIEKASRFTVPGCFFLLPFLPISPDHHICPRIFQACPQCPRSRSYYLLGSKTLCMYKIYDFSSSISS